MSSGAASSSADSAAAAVASALGVDAGEGGDARLRPCGRRRLPVIDVHTHILPEAWPSLKERYGYGGFVQLSPSARAGGRARARMFCDDGTPFRDVDERCWSLSARLADADARRVDAMVLSTVPAMFSYFAAPADGLDLAQMLNDHMGRAVAAAPRRLVGLATLPLQAPSLAAAELARCVRTLGLRGAQIGSRVNAATLADAALDPVWRAAEELDAAIFVHPWGGLMDATLGAGAGAGAAGTRALPAFWLPWLVGMPAETTQAVCAMHFSGVFDRFPRLRVLFAHGAGAFPYTVGRIQHGFDVRPDLCATHTATPPRSLCGRFWADSLVHDADALALAVKVLGEDRVCLGTDYPFVLGETTAESRGDVYAAGALIDACGLPALVKDKLRSANALAWLGMRPEDLGVEGE